MKETVREPLLLFLVLGAVLYGAWALLAPGDVGTVRIEAAALRGMEAQQTEILGRPLTDAERHDLFEGYIDDEVLLREAVRRGLQWSDFRARQRLVRIMRGALTETVPDPSVAQLQAHFSRNIDKYTTPKSAHIELVVYPWGRDVPDGVLAKLRAGADSTTLGVETAAASRRMPRATRRDLVMAFGAQFADSVEKLSDDEWHGPIESVQGVHFVQIKERAPPSVPKFEDVESYLRQEWLMTKTREGQQARVDEIRGKYRIAFVEE